MTPSTDVEKASFRSSSCSKRTETPATSGRQAGLTLPTVESEAAVAENPGGAPVEESSPLGKNVGRLGVMSLNVGMMIGTGIFVTPGLILQSVGSVGATMILWLIGIILSFCMLHIYNELVGYFPNRSGSQVVYLEQAYPRPRFLFPVVYAVVVVIFSFSASNCLAAAQLLLAAGQASVTEAHERGLAVAIYVFVCASIMVSTKWSMRLVTLLTVVKVIVLFFVIITGLVVLGGNVPTVPDPHANFRNSFAGTSSNGGAWATALIKVLFSFLGYENATNVVAEVPNSARTLRWWGNVALGLVSVFYIMVPIAYFATIPAEAIKASQTLTAALFFGTVFGENAGARVLPALVAISAIGNVLAVTIGQARVIREVGRQGLLPFPKFWTTTKPFGSPLGPVAVLLLTTTIVLVAPPIKDAFPFLVDLQLYPVQLFNFVTVVALLLIRRQRGRDTLAPGAARAWAVEIAIGLLGCLALLVLPWIPPAGGAKGGDVSFWYATYCAAGLGIVAACLAYYVVWMVLLPRLGRFHYEIRTLRMDDGAALNTLVKVKNSE